MPFEICLDGVNSLGLEVVDASGPSWVFSHEAGVLQEAQVPRHRGPADRQRCGDFLHRLVTAAQQPQDLAPIRVTERLERIPCCRRRNHVHHHLYR